MLFNIFCVASIIILRIDKGLNGTNIWVKFGNYTSSATILEFSYSVKKFEIFIKSRRNLTSEKKQSFLKLPYNKKFFVKCVLFYSTLLLKDA